jgi:hypothetical protein
MNRLSVVVVLALAVSATSPLASHAEISACLPDEHGNFICGIGDGAARVIAKTISPSKRLALAWRMPNKPLSYQPDDHDTDLENLVVRIKDGAVLAKTHGSYWENGIRQAKANVFAAWSPSSNLLVASVEQVDSEVAEIFVLTENDAVIGPFDFLKVIQPAVRAEMKGVSDANKYDLRFAHTPQMTIDNQGLMHASVFMSRTEADKPKIYDVTAQVIHTTSSLEAKVLSVSQYAGPYISVEIYQQQRAK